jgi:nucleotide-binding universal stress UspA family protein
MYKHILLPCDGAELSLKAVDEGIKLAKALGSNMTLITVIAPYSMNVPHVAGAHLIRDLEERHQEEATKAAQLLQSELAARAKSTGVQLDCVVVTSERPYVKIIETAEARKCDLILMASHGRRGLDGLLLGSETVKVLTHSKIPVLVVR